MSTTSTQAGDESLHASKATSSNTISSSSGSGPRKIKVYTKTGDKGTSSLFNMQRASKAADTFHALGEVDELNASLGLAYEHLTHSIIPAGSPLIDQLPHIQSRLFDVGSHVATPQKSSSAAQLERTAFDVDHITRLEEWIDEMDKELPPLRNFILPSGGLPATQLHVCRAVCRRAERAVIPLLEREDIDAAVAKYLNRLSDYLFVSARWCAQKEGKEEVTWKKPREKREQAKQAAEATDAAIKKG